MKLRASQDNLSREAKKDFSGSNTDKHTVKVIANCVTATKVDLATAQQRNADPFQLPSSKESSLCLSPNPVPRYHRPTLLSSPLYHQDQPPEQRWAYVKQSGACFRCLQFGHKAATCPDGICGLHGCRRHHHPTLHVSRVMSHWINPRKSAPVD